mgnify:CR=1 FL=1
MKKNISINLQGMIFHIEEDGYEQLSQYLAAIKAYFSAYAGTPIPGVPNANPLTVTCTPNCGAGSNGGSAPRTSAASSSGSSRAGGNTRAPSGAARRRPCR